MLFASALDDVRIVDGKLVVSDATQCLLGRLLAPTDNPRTQLRHLAQIIDELEALALHGGSSFNRLTVIAARQLKESLQLALSYTTFRRRADEGEGRRRQAA